MGLFQQNPGVAIMAMPYMERAKNPNKWLLNLASKIDTYKGAIKKTIYELKESIKNFSCIKLCKKILLLLKIL